MHPEDVRELVSEQFAELERMLDKRPELRVQHAALEDVDIFLNVTVETNASAQLTPGELQGLGGEKQLIIPSGVVPGAPGGGAMLLFVGIPQSVPLLGQKTTRDLLLRVGCDGFNGRPPLAELLRPEDRSPLPDDEWPRDPSGQGIVPAHPIYNRKFFCRPGLREFHELDQHADTPWDARRESSTIGWIVVTLLGELQTRWTMV